MDHVVPLLLSPLLVVLAVGAPTVPDTPAARVHDALMASTHACLAPPALRAPAVAGPGGLLSSLLPVALAVVVLSSLAGYVAFRIILLRHTPAARKLRREHALPVAAAQQPVQAAPPAAGPLPPGSTAPITPESQSPARRPPSATGEGVPGLPGQQARCHAVHLGAAACAALHIYEPLVSSLLGRL